MYALMQALLKPFPLLIWLTALLLVLLWRRCPEQRRRLRWVGVVYAVLLLSTLPLTALLTTRWLESAFPKVTARPDSTRAIVVLGGGVIPSFVEGQAARLDQSSLYRTLRAFELYRAGSPCPILVTGGNPDPQARNETAAVLMTDLLRHLGVAEEHLILEDRSRNTAGNAAYSAAILRERDLEEGVLMVSSATHLWRAEQFFRKQGLTVTPAGCDYQADRIPLTWALFWPSGTAVSQNQTAWHEFLGVLWARLRGQL